MGTKQIFRELREDDMTGAEAVIRRAYDEIVGRKLPTEIAAILRDRRLRDIHSAKGRRFVLEEHDTIVGTAAVLKPEDSEFSRSQYEGERGLAEVKTVAAYPPFRGYGTALMAGAEEYARATGYTGLILDANSGSGGFYERLGFKTLRFFTGMVGDKELSGPVMVKLF